MSDDIEVEIAAGWDFQTELLNFLPQLQRQALALTRNKTAADDLVQDALVNAIRAQSSFKPGTNFPAWMHTILRNRFISIRRKTRETTDIADIAPHFLAQQPGQEDHLRITELERGLKLLPEHQREALMAFVLRGESYGDYASQNGIALNTAKAHVHRARRALAHYMEKGRLPKEFPGIKVALGINAIQNILYGVGSEQPHVEALHPPAEESETNPGISGDVELKQPSALSSIENQDHLLPPSAGASADNGQALPLPHVIFSERQVGQLGPEISLKEERMRVSSIQGYEFLTDYLPEVKDALLSMEINTVNQLASALQAIDPKAAKLKSWTVYVGQFLHGNMLEWPKHGLLTERLPRLLVQLVQSHDQYRDHSCTMLFAKVLAAIPEEAQEYWQLAFNVNESESIKRRPNPSRPISPRDPQAKPPLKVVPANLVEPLALQDLIESALNFDAIYGPMAKIMFGLYGLREGGNPLDWQKFVIAQVAQLSPEIQSWWRQTMAMQPAGLNLGPVLLDKAGPSQRAGTSQTPTYNTAAERPAPVVGAPDGESLFELLGDVHAAGQHVIADSGQGQVPLIEPGDVAAASVERPPTDDGAHQIAETGDAGGNQQGQGPAAAIPNDVLDKPSSDPQLQALSDAFPAVGQLLTERKLLSVSALWDAIPGDYRGQRENFEHGLAELLDNAQPFLAQPADRLKPIAALIGLALSPTQPIKELWAGNSVMITRPRQPSQFAALVDLLSQGCVSLLSTREQRALTPDQGQFSITRIKELLSSKIANVPKAEKAAKLNNMMAYFSGKISPFKGGKLDSNFIELVDLLSIESTKLVEALPVLKDQLLYSDLVRTSFPNLAMLMMGSQAFTLSLVIERRSKITTNNQAEQILRALTVNDVSPDDLHHPDGEVAAMLGQAFHVVPRDIFARNILHYDPPGARTHGRKPLADHTTGAQSPK
jgi:RNA polymerase sigma-70 factor (ECF subfamily)